MKKLLLFFIIVPFLFSCGGDDESFDDEITSKDIVGSWSTGVEGTLKYISFDEGNSGFFALYSGAKLVSSYTFDYVISEGQISIKIKFSLDKDLIGKTKSWDYELSAKSLRIKNEAESGAYSRIE